MLAGDLEHAGIDLAHLLPATRILGRERPGQRAGSSSHVDDPAGVRHPQDDPRPPQVVELQMGRIGEIDVRGIHLALTQQPSRRPRRIAFNDEVTALLDDRWDGA